LALNVSAICAGTSAEPPGFAQAAFRLRRPNLSPLLGSEGRKRRLRTFFPRLSDPPLPIVPI
jgi:hypothetical protein